ncbi:hypothetical protein DW051_10000 [Bacteroides uniformis]|nr:hypothetical protein DW051_10000 [Bacteroides uniformis]
MIPTIKKAYIYCISHRESLPLNPILKGQNIPIFSPKTSPCFGAIHPGVLGIQSYSERYSVTESLP